MQVGWLAVSGYRKERGRGQLLASTGGWRAYFRIRLSGGNYFLEKSIGNDKEIA